MLALLKRIALQVLAMLAFVGLAHADGAIVTHTVRATEWILKSADIPVISRHPTREVCELAGKAFNKVGESFCDQRVTITAVGACAPEAPPFPTRINAEGFLEAPGIVVKENPDGSWGPTMEEGYLPTPLPYPDCWQIGLVPYTGKWHAPEGPPVNDPVYLPGEEPVP